MNQGSLFTLSLSQSVQRNDNVLQQHNVNGEFREFFIQNMSNFQFRHANSFIYSLASMHAPYIGIGSVCLCVCVCVIWVASLAAFNFYCRIFVCGVLGRRASAPAKTEKIVKHKNRKLPATEWQCSLNFRVRHDEIAFANTLSYLQTSRIVVTFVDVMLHAIPNDQRLHFHGGGDGDSVMRTTKSQQYCYIIHRKKLFVKMLRSQWSGAKEAETEIERETKIVTP